MTDTQKKLPVIAKKTFEGYLILDYRTGKFRTMSKEPVKSKLNGHEIPVKLVFKVNVPENPTYVATAEVTLSQEQVDSMIMEAL